MNALKKLEVKKWGFFEMKKYRFGYNYTLYLFFYEENKWNYLG